MPTYNHTHEIPPPMVTTPTKRDSLSASSGRTCRVCSVVAMVDLVVIAKVRYVSFLKMETQLRDRFFIQGRPPRTGDCPQKNAKNSPAYKADLMLNLIPALKCR